jgi:two-component system, NarL family, response regulator NreC
MPQINVLIVDDHPIFSKGLAALLSSQPLFSIAGEARNSCEAMEIIQIKQPDLAIVDLNLGNEDGLDFIKNVHALYSQLKILVLSMHDERYYASRAIKAGALGYIMKEEAGSNVIMAIRTVMSGKVYLSRSECVRMEEVKLDTDSDKKDDISLLSDRQLQIFTFIGQGLGTVEIAARLGLSTKTVDTHKEHMKLKLHCETAQELRQLAVEWIHTNNKSNPISHR